MIVRNLTVEMIEQGQFDYFNDYKNTRHHFTVLLWRVLGIKSYTDTANIRELSTEELTEIERISGLLRMLDQGYIEYRSFDGKGVSVISKNV